MYLAKFSIYVKYFSDPESSIRYYFLLKTLNKYNVFKKVKSIVDVGGGSRTFYPEIKNLIDDKEVTLTSVDTTFNQGEIFNSVVYKNKINSKDMYDLVCSVDTLEHIPPKDRKNFITSLYNASNKYLLLSFPCGKKSEIQDLYLHKMYIKKHVDPHKFLQEHVDFKLPNVTETLKVLEVLGGNVLEVNYNTNIYYRKILMLSWITLNKFLFKFITPILFILGILFNFFPKYRCIIIVIKNKKV